MNREEPTPIEVARSSLLSYIGMQYPKYTAEPMHELIATALEAVEAGNIKRLLIFAPPQHGKCLYEDTLITLSSGKRETARDIKIGTKILGYKNGKLIRSELVAKEFTKKESIKLTTKTGREIIVSTDHRMLTYNGYKKATDITLDDFLLTIHKEIELNLPKINEDELRFITYMLFEGMCETEITEGRNFSNIDPIVIKDFLRVCNNLNIHTSKAAGKNRCEFYVGVQSRDLLDKYKIRGYRCTEKRLPEEFFSMPLEQRWIFIDLMFQTDGYFALSAGQGGIALANKELIEDIQTLLSTCGIASTKSYKPNNFSNAWVLTVGRSQLVKVYKNCDLGSKREFFAKILRKPGHSKITAFPNAIGKTVARTRENGFRCDNKKNITLEKMQRMVKVYPELQKYLNMDFIYDQVIKKEYAGKRKLVHLQTTNTHTYIANDLVSHNTMLTSEFFPAWVIGRNPDWKVIAATFNQTRANEVGGVVRDQFKGSIHKAVFPECTVSPDTQSAQHVATEQRGHYYSIGLSGTGTGRGADCLPAETLIPALIDGEKKTLAIATIYSLQQHKEVKVLSFNHNINKLIYKRVVAARRTFTDELFEITTNSGYNIRATGNHRFFVSGQGYIHAKALRTGDRFTTSTIEEKQNLYKLPKTKKWKGSILSNVLQRITQSRNRNNLYMVWQKNHKKSIRNSQSNQKRAQRPILFPQMLASPSCSQEQTQMYQVWKANRNKNTQILRSRVQTSSEGCYQTSKETMSTMWGVLQTTQQQNPILFKELCRSRSFRTYDGQGKFTLQRWDELRQTIQGNKAFYSKKRQRPMRYMRDVYGITYYSQERLDRPTNTQQYISTPYQWRSYKQHSRKFNMSMYNLSCNTSQITRDTISSIKRISTKALPVYDIQVEGTSNFFANKILTHNCFLIDDPFKGREDAESKLGREKVKEFYKSVAYSRLRPGGRIVIINTRWQLDDLSGYVVKEFPFENWKIIDLKAIAEENDILGRKVGEALCPKMYPIEELKIKKRVQGTYNWESLYQQRPIPREGGMIKYKWVEDNYYTELPKEEDIIKTVISWDTAYRPDELNDPTAATVWLVAKNGYYLIDVFNEKLEFYKIIRKVKQLHNDYHPSAHLIEGRATGQTVIDELKRTTNIPVVERSTKNLEKGVRLDAVSGLFESGKVWFPERAPWLIETKDQLCLFPSYKHDDITDSISQFLNWVVNKSVYVRKPPSKLYWK